MCNTIRILFPAPPSQKEIYFKGYVDTSDDCVDTSTIYIVKYSTYIDNFLEGRKDDNIIYGYFGNSLPKKRIFGNHNYIHLQQNSKLLIKKLVIDGNQISNTNNCIIMFYDYDSIKKSQAICTPTNDYFSKLVTLIQDEHGQSNQRSHVSDLRNPSWVGTAMILQHIYNYWRLIKWLFSTIRGDKKVSIKQGNLILAIIMDLILGYIALQLLPQDKTQISSTLMQVLERLIHFLYGLLKWLMGAPVGLKLNNAFNKMLGKYFSYHVQLWWLFLDVAGEKLHIILDIYYYIGYLGLTFQIAIITDLICIATFHSYCIYVYAARLFNIQISGIIALFRLFVGRKYNPLRGGIDSCEYTNQELFVGTVAFTILLLLLPTTTLYYIVFTGFRVVSLIIQNTLAKWVYMIQVSPLYIMLLWIKQSPKIRGNIKMEIINDTETAPLVLRIKLFNKSIPELVQLFKPPVDTPKQVEWTNLLSNVLVGKQIL